MSIASIYSSQIFLLFFRKAILVYYSYISTLLLRMPSRARLMLVPWKLFFWYKVFLSFLTQYNQQSPHTHLPEIRRFWQLLLRNDNALNSTCHINIVREDRNLAIWITPKCFCIGLRYMMNVFIVSIESRQLSGHFQHGDSITGWTECEYTNRR